MKKAIFLAVFILLGPAFLALILGNQVQAVSLSDLGLESAGLLPSNPFYFFKEWRRGLSRVFAVDPGRKADLALEDWNERAAELKKLAEITPQNREAVGRALDNYRAGLGRLADQFVFLRPERLNLFVGRGLKHLELFAELQAQSEETAGIAEEVAALLVRTPDFPGRLTGPLKELQAVEILDLAGAGTESQEKLLRQFVEQVKQRRVTATMLKDLAGDSLRRLKILDRARLNLSDPDLKSQLNLLRQQFLDLVGPDKIIGENEAQAALAAARLLLKENGGGVKTVTEQARFHLDQAERFYDEKNWSGVIGQANSVVAALGK